MIAGREGLRQLTHGFTHLDSNTKLMPLTHTKELFTKALKGKYALGAFNVNNMELLQAIVEACEEEKAPVMLQISKGARQYANPVYLKKLIEAAISLSNIPIAVHLDHGDSFDLCKECIDEGFTSVMIDGSHEPFAKNVEVCKRVVEYAHKHNCVVEGELGMLVGAQHDDAIMLVGVVHYFFADLGKKVVDYAHKHN